MTAVALDRLHHEGEGRAVDPAADGISQQLRMIDGQVRRSDADGRSVGVGPGNAHYRRHECPELVVRVRPAGRQAGHGPTVVAVVQGHQRPGARTVLGRQLHGHLHGRAAVEAVGDLGQAVRREPDEPVREEEERDRVVVAASVRDLLGLRRGRRQHCRVAGADVVRPRLRGAVEVLVAITIPDGAAFGPRQQDRHLGRFGGRPAPHQRAPAPRQRGLIDGLRLDHVALSR